MAPRHPCWRMLISTPSLWACFSSPMLPWLFWSTAYTQCLPSPDHLEGSASPVKSSSSFKAFLNASRSKSFADISSYPGPVLWNLAELTHNSFMEPTFLKSLVVVIVCACACIHIHVFVCPLVCRHMCVHVAVRSQLQCHLHKCHLLPWRQPLSLAWTELIS